MSEPKLINLDPRLMQPNPWNTNILTPENEAKLEESIKRLGFFRPAVVREIANSLNSEISYQILGGEHRAQVAIRLGMLTIPVVNLGQIDELKAKEIGIADNSRYGLDDQLAFADLIRGMGSAAELKDFLPYTEHDFTELFTTADIDLDELDQIEDNFERDRTGEGDETPEPVKAPKTHTVIRFKVSNRDAEEIVALIERTKKDLGFTASDDLTNSGDALVALLLSTRITQTQNDAADELADLEDI